MHLLISTGKLLSLNCQLQNDKLAACWDKADLTRAASVSESVITTDQVQYCSTYNSSSAAPSCIFKLPLSYFSSKNFCIPELETSWTYIV